PHISKDFLLEEILSDAKVAYQRREDELGSDTMRELERRVVLSVIGRKWQEHLYEMDYLKEGIGLRAMAQRDPLVEYQREGYTMFQSMMEAIREESVGFLFNLEVKVQKRDTDGDGVEDESEVSAAGLEAPERPASMQYSAPSVSGEVETRVERRQKATAGAGAKAGSGAKSSTGTNRAAQRANAKKKR
ncbi:MAG TPA: preprotein translocase subunit SecA, partial [Arthrobacter sp.]|nr:preprotein translocase subunit SecA [Arthrobacter sp.]